MDIHPFNNVTPAYFQELIKQRQAAIHHGNLHEQRKQKTEEFYHAFLHNWKKKSPSNSTAPCVLDGNYPCIAQTPIIFKRNGVTIS
jgi:hypothetical protein